MSPRFWSAEGSSEYCGGGVLERDQAGLDRVAQGRGAGVDGGRVALGRAEQEQDVGDLDPLGLLLVEVGHDAVEHAAVGEVGAGQLVAVLGDLGDVRRVLVVAGLLGGEHLELEVDVAVEKVEPARERRLGRVDDGAVGGGVGRVEGGQRQRVGGPGGDDGRAVGAEHGAGVRAGPAAAGERGGDEREQGEAGRGHRVSKRGKSRAGLSGASRAGKLTGSPGRSVQGGAKKALGTRQVSEHATGHGGHGAGPCARLGAGVEGRALRHDPPGHAGRVILDTPGASSGPQHGWARGRAKAGRGGRRKRRPPGNDPFRPVS